MSARLNRWNVAWLLLVSLRLPLVVLMAGDPVFSTFALIYAVGASCIDIALAYGAYMCSREFGRWGGRVSFAGALVGLTLGALFSLAGGLLVALYPGVLLYEAVFAGLATGAGFAVGLLLGTGIDAIARPGHESR